MKCGCDKLRENLREASIRKGFIEVETRCLIVREENRDNNDAVQSKQGLEIR